MRLCEKVNAASALSAVLPRIDCATRLSLRGLVRMFRPTARAWVSERERLCAGLPIGRCGSGRAGRGGAFTDLGFTVPGVAVENACRRELAELVADHVLGDHDRYVLLSVVDAEGQPH